jgi:NADPH:quinone reductase-like Zn-dependent oxidoreductase
MVRSRLLKQRLVSFEASVTKEDLTTLKEFIESGKVRPVIDSTFPLHEAAAAIRRLESGSAQGKVVITT